MVKLNEQFNAEEHEAVDFAPLPNGKYKAVVSNSEMKESKAGHNYIAFTLEIIDGQYKGRLLWENCNHTHPNEQTRKIANGRLSAMSKAVGMVQLMDTSELHNKPMLIEVAQKKRNDTGEMQNVIRSFDSLSAAPAQEAQQTSEKKPWES